MKVTAIVVSHNSWNTIERCIQALRTQSHPIHEIIIVDSGSRDTGYLEQCKIDDHISIYPINNVGYSMANNIGFQRRRHASDFVLFLNPDTFLFQDFVEKAVSVMQRMPAVGALSGRLLGYDPEKERETGKIDSTGIFRKAYGRWYDRGQNIINTPMYMEAGEVPALCGALLFCRCEALVSLGHVPFDPDFFLYKEDIEFSLRLRKNGWKLYYAPHLSAYHCRGWKKRHEIPYHLRKTAAESEILLYKKHPSPYIIWAFLKYWLVMIFRM